MIHQKNITSFLTFIPRVSFLLVNVVVRLKENHQNILHIVPLSIPFVSYNSAHMFLVLLLLVTLTTSEIVPLHRYVVQQIFQENKLYLIYVHGSTHNFELQSEFNGYCFGDKLCAVLDPNIEGYAEFLQYVGNNEEEYFLMLDSQDKRKYILSPKDRPITQNDLLTFEYGVLNKEIDPFFASEEVPYEVNEKCSKLVGRSLGEFLRREDRMKVVLLYSLSGFCSNCHQMLPAFQSLAEEYHSPGEVVFGYFDTFLNDHPVIQDEKNPSLLIFIDQNYQHPFELPAYSLDNLKTFINKSLRRKPSVEQPSTQEL